MTSMRSLYRPGIFHVQDITGLAERASNDRRAILMETQHPPRTRIQINTNQRKSPPSHNLYKPVQSPLSSSQSLASLSKSSSTSITITETDEPANDQLNDYYIDDLKNLTEDDIQFLLDNTGFTNEQMIRWHTDFLVKCTTGLITSAQFKAYYSLLLPERLADDARAEILDKLFGLFDIDGDGCLNFTEFLVSFWIRCKAPIREKYTWIFNMLDSDR